MLHNGKIIIKTGLVVLTALLLLSSGTGALSLGEAAASEPQEASSSLPEKIVPDAIIVKFMPSVSLPARVEQAEVTGISSIDALAARFEVKRISQLFRNSRPPADPTKVDLSRFYRVEFPEKFPVQEVSAAFLQNPNVESVEVIGIHPVFPTTPNDTYFSAVQWNLNNTGQTIQGNLGTVDADVDAPEAWDLTHGSSSVKLAIVDTGVDWQHEDLGGSSPYTAGNIWINTGETADNSIDDDGNGFVDDIRGWDWVDLSSESEAYSGEDWDAEDNDPMDFNGHGTHCSGIASAITNNNKGVAGLGWDCQIMALRAGWTAANGNGYVSSAFTGPAIVYATDMGATAINCSWGSSYSESFAAAVQYAIDNGVVVVVAAGNGNSDTQSYLASRGDCIDVAGTNNDDVKWTSSPTSGSNYGTWVDVSAPGEDIPSTYNLPDPYMYVYLTGTSMAAPHVVGLCGLLKSYYPSITAREIRQRIYHTTDNIDSVVGNEAYAGKLGSGRINAYKALALYWRSQSSDGLGGTLCDLFDVYPDENTVYMYGASFLASHEYRVAYYDGDGDKVADDINVNSDSSGNLESQYTFDDTPPADQPGTWHAIVCERAPPDPLPSTYNPDWEHIILDDSFEVLQSAIPEFPTTVAAIAALALSAGIYLWMRRKAAPVPA